MKTKIIYLFAFVLLAVIGCDDREIDDFQNNENNTLQVSVSVPEETPVTRSIESPYGSKNIVVKWQANETLSLYFKQGSTLKQVENVPLTNVSSNGKKANFKVQVPAGINATQPYTLYGVYGTSSKVKDGKPVADVTTRTAQLINGKNTMKVPMYFKQTINGNMPNITFKHLGAMLVYEAYNNTRYNVVKPYLAYLRTSEYKTFPYYLGTKREPFNLEQEKVVSTQSTSGFGFDQFLREQVEKATTNFNAGRSMRMVQWVSPKQFSGRKYCEINFITTSGLGTIQAPQMQRGRAYHIELTYSKNSNNNSVLAVNASEATTPGKMLVRTGNNKIRLKINAPAANRSNCWIDLNRNAVRDGGENIYFARWHDYTLSSGASGYAFIYGKVTELRIAENQDLKEVKVQSNKALKTLEIDKNNLTQLDVSQNVKLEELIIRNRNNSDMSKKLAKLDVSNNIRLKELWLVYTKVQTLDIAGNIWLEKLILPFNQFKELDISKHRRIKRFYGNSNKLTKLNVANGNNRNFTQCYASENPNLTCIKVDYNFVPNASKWKKDHTASWNNTGQECGAPGKLVFAKDNSTFYDEPSSRDKCFHTYYSKGAYTHYVNIKNIGVEPVKVNNVEINKFQTKGEVKCITPLNFTVGAGETKSLVFKVTPKKYEKNDGIYYNAIIKTTDGKEIVLRAYLGVDEKLEGKVTNDVYGALNGSAETFIIFDKKYDYKKEYVDTDKDGIISVREAREYKGTLVLWDNISDWGDNDKNPFWYFTNITTLQADFGADWQRLKYLKNLKRVFVYGPYEHLAKAMWRNGKDGIKKLEEMMFYVSDDGNDDYGTLDKDEFPSLKKWWSHGYRYPDGALQPQLTHYHIDGSPMKTTGSVKNMVSLEDLFIAGCPRLKKFYLPKNYKGAGITIKVKDCPNIEKVYVAPGYTPSPQDLKNWGIQGNPDVVHY